MHKTGAGKGWTRMLFRSADRMLGSGAALQLAVLSAVAALNAETGFAAAPSMLTIALSTLILGLALDWVPRRLKAMPPDYPVYGAAGMLLTIGGLLSLFPSPWLFLPGIALALAGWHVGMRSLSWKLDWSPTTPAPALRAIHWLLRGAGLAMAALLLTRVMGLPAAGPWIAGAALVALAGAGSLMALNGSVTAALREKHRPG